MKDGNGATGLSHNDVYLILQDISVLGDQKKWLPHRTSKHCDTGKRNDAADDDLDGGGRPVAMLWTAMY